MLLKKIASIVGMQISTQKALKNKKVLSKKTWTPNFRLFIGEMSNKIARISIQC